VKGSAVSSLDREAVLEELLGVLRPQDALIVLEEEERALTRFSDNAIRQNLLRRDRTLVLQLRFKGRAGVGVCHTTGEEDLKSLVQETRIRAEKLPKDPDLPPLASRRPHRRLRGFYKSTAEAPPKEKSKKIKEALEILSSRDLKGSGFFETIIHRLWVINTKGVNKHFEETVAAFRLIAKTKNGSTGFAQARSRKIEDIRPDEIAVRAMKKALWGNKKRKMPDGAYTVILEPEPLAHLILFLGFLGLGGKTFLSGMSFMRRNMGKKIVGANITLIDDATDPRTLGVPFDYEGVPKKRVVLIEKGVAKNVVTDMRTAKKLGKESTGHALRPDNHYGPYPKNLILESGEKSVEEMLKDVEKGILISRFWYVNFANPMLTEVTGSTRDGTLLIENGEITGGVEDMRFLVSILDVLNKVRELSKKQTLTYRYGAHLLVPAVLVEGFKLEGGA